MSSTIAYNSILVSSLQEDEDMMLSFENVSWLSKLIPTIQFEMPNIRTDY